MWTYIEAGDWATHSTESKGYETVKVFFLSNYKEILIKRMRAFITMRYNELDERIREHEAKFGRIEAYGGDDSYGDMIYHVIGLGKEYYESVIEDPDLLNELKFVESFAYAIPYDDDFKAMDIDFHKARGLEALQFIVDIMVNNNPSTQDIETMRQMQNRFMFLAGGDLAEATRGFSKDRYDEYYKFESNDQMARFSNYLSEAEVFLKIAK